MNYKSMKIDDIIKWCQDNGQIDWLKSVASQTVACKVYPRIKGEDGKVRADRTKPYTVEDRPITFIQIKRAFCEKFMPEIIPAKTEKKTMYDRIMSL